MVLVDNYQKNYVVKYCSQVINYCIYIIVRNKPPYYRS